MQRHDESLITRLQCWLFLRGCYDELVAAQTPADRRHWHAAVERFRVLCGLAIAEDRWRDRLRDHLERQKEVA